MGEEEKGGSGRRMAEDSGGINLVASPSWQSEDGSEKIVEDERLLLSNARFVCVNNANSNSRDTV